MQNIQNNNTTCFHSRGQGHYGIDNGRIIGKTAADVPRIYINDDASFAGTLNEH